MENFNLISFQPYDTGMKYILPGTQHNMKRKATWLGNKINIYAVVGVDTQKLEGHSFSDRNIGI